MNNNSEKQDLELIEDLVSKYNETTAQIAKVIVGQDQAVKQILSTVFVGGHQWGNTKQDKEGQMKILYRRTH